MALTKKIGSRCCEVVGDIHDKKIKGHLQNTVFLSGATFDSWRCVVLYWSFLSAHSLARSTI